MKKFIAVLLTFCILVSAYSVGAFAGLSGAELLGKYDFNADNAVNILDARKLLRVSANMEAPDETKNYDVNGDGVVNQADVMKTLYTVLGIEEEVSENKDVNVVNFRNELNAVKTSMPGFKKTSDPICKSMRVTTANAPVEDLNVTDKEFSEYTEIVCSYTENLLNGPLGLLMKEELKKEYRESMAQMRDKAKAIYESHPTTTTVAKGAPSHVNKFPVNNLGNACLLKADEVESITSELTEDGYIKRTVTLGEYTYVGDEYPTGSAGFSYRWQHIPYGKVFNLPPLDEKTTSTEVSVLNKVTFKDGKIVSIVDPSTGMAIDVTYSYTYIADMTSTEYDKDGNISLKMTTVATMDMFEHCEINH